MALRNAGKDETSHPNEFSAASLVNKIGTSNGMTKTQIVAACRGAGSLTEAFKIPAAVTPTGLSTALIGKEMLNFFGEENMVAMVSLAAPGTAGAVARGASERNAEIRVRI